MGAGVELWLKAQAAEISAPYCPACLPAGQAGHFGDLVSLLEDPRQIHRAPAVAHPSGAVGLDRDALRANTLQADG